MFATYLAAAALIECYVKNGGFGNSSGYSYEDLKRMCNENLVTIRELGSEQPYIRLPDSKQETDNENYENNNSGRDSDDRTVRSAK